MPADEAHQVHLHAGLVAVAPGEHDAGGLGPQAEDRADGAVDLGVHQDHVLAVLDARTAPGGSRTRRRRSRRRRRRPAPAGTTAAKSSVTTGTPAASAASASATVLDPPSTGDAGLAVGALGLGDRAVDDGDHAHAGRRVDDLVDQTAAHEAGADQGHPDRAALGLAALQRGVDDDHELAPTVSGCQP